MALKGYLHDFSTTQLLNLISLSRKTGTLTVQGSNVAFMSFREGKLIYASMDSNNSSLAHVLEKSGMLSRAQGQVIKTRASGTSDKHLGHILVQAGFVTQSDIIQSVRGHILDVVYKMFTWADGVFRFDANKVPPMDRITVPIDLESVIMEGSRRLKEWERLQEELPNLGAHLKFANRPNSRLKNINLTVEEWRVVSFVSPQNTINQIALAANLNEFEIRRIVFGLLQAGLVQLVDKIEPTISSNGSSPPVSQDDLSDEGPSVKRSVITRLIDRIRTM